MTIRIVLRTCSRVNAFTGPDRNLRFRGSEQPMGKEVNLKGCVRSLRRAIEHAVAFHPDCVFDWTIFDDNSSDAVYDFLSREVKDAYGVKHTYLESTAVSGNGPSLAACFEYGRLYPDDLILFIEDDYLCKIDMLTEMISFYYILHEVLDGREPCLHPLDDPGRYAGGLAPTYVMMGENSHWRQIQKTTCTFMVRGSVLNEYWPIYNELTKYGIDPKVSEENTVNLLYTSLDEKGVPLVPCFAPIPTLALHLQYEHTISPFVTWEQWWKEYAYE